MQISKDTSSVTPTKGRSLALRGGSLGTRVLGKDIKVDTNQIKELRLAIQEIPTAKLTPRRAGSIGSTIMTFYNRNDHLSPRFVSQAQHLEHATRNFNIIT
jgi:hypothetical protein